MVRDRGGGTLSFFAFAKGLGWVGVGWERGLLSVFAALLTLLTLGETLERERGGINRYIEDSLWAMDFLSLSMA